MKQITITPKRPYQFPITARFVQTERNARHASCILWESTITDDATGNTFDNGLWSTVRMLDVLRALKASGDYEVRYELK